MTNHIKHCHNYNNNNGSLLAGNAFSFQITALPNEVSLQPFTFWLVSIFMPTGLVLVGQKLTTL